MRNLIDRVELNKHDGSALSQSNQSFTSRKMDWMTAAAYDRRLKPSDFRIAFVIAQHINKKTGKAFPSREEIADKANTSVPTVKRTIKLLQETGWITVRRKRSYDPKVKGWKTHNFYWLRFENVQTVFDLIKASRLKRRHVKGVTGDPFKWVTHDPLTPSYQHLQKRRESTEGGTYLFQCGKSSQC
jgi:primosomal protein N'